MLKKGVKVKSEDETGLLHTLIGIILMMGHTEPWKGRAKVRWHRFIDLDGIEREMPYCDLWVPIEELTEI